MQRWIVRMAEIQLKSRPVRRHMRVALERQLKAQGELRGVELSLQPWHGLLLAHAPADSDPEAAADAFRHTFGIVAIDPAEQVEAAPESVADALEAGGFPEGVGSTFAIRCRRHGPKGKWGSQQFAAALGAEVQRRAPHLEVDLGEPDWEVRVALMPDYASLLAERIPGPGGLPTGVQGNVRSKLAEESDLLAAWLVMRRGCRIIIDDGADPALRARLTVWDAALADDEWALKLNSGPGPGHAGRVWGRVGADLDEFEAVDDRNVPLVRLEPLAGWSEARLTELKHRFGIA